MIHTQRDLSHPVLYGNEKALIGRDGRMFYLGRDMVRQSAGLVLRDQKVANAVDMLAEMRDALARRGASLIGGGGAEFLDDLPGRSSAVGAARERKTEYDLFLADLAARGIKTVDLRPVMEKARADGEAYLMHDTHWTARSAVLAFNAVAEAAGHPDWRLDPETSIGPPAERRGGDVARIIGVEDEVSETVRELAVPSAGKSEDLSPGPMPDWVLSSARPGPTIMVIGDSFTASYFPPMLAQHAGRAIWLNHRAMRLRLGGGRETSAGRGLVDSDRALSDLRRGSPAAQLGRSVHGSRPGRRPRNVAGLSLATRRRIRRKGLVIPAHAGIQSRAEGLLDARFRGHDGRSGVSSRPSDARRCIFLRCRN